MRLGLMGSAQNARASVPRGRPFQAKDYSLISLAPAPGETRSAGCAFRGRLEHDGSCFTEGKF